MIDDIALHRFSTIVDLTPGEDSFLRGLGDRTISYEAGKPIRSEGDEPGGIFMLHEGWILSSITNADGRRQIHKVHRAGDIFGAPSLPFEATVESLIALTPCKVSSIALFSLGELFAKAPRLGAVLFLLAQEERAALMDRLMAAGRLSAKHNVAALLLVLHRGGPSGGKGTLIHQPMTQSQIADVLGLSTVHVSRSLIALESGGFIRRDGHTYDLLDIARLDAFVGLPARKIRRNPTWLPPATL